MHVVTRQFLVASRDHDARPRPVRAPFVDFETYGRIRPHDINLLAFGRKYPGGVARPRENDGNDVGLSIAVTGDAPDYLRIEKCVNLVPGEFIDHGGELTSGLGSWGGDLSPIPMAVAVS